MILQDQLTKGSRDVMGRGPSNYVTFLSSLVAIGIVVAYIMVLICHVISEDSMSKRLLDLMVRVSYVKSPSCQIWCPYALWWCNYVFGD